MRTERASSELILVVGAPLRSHNALFNCAVVLHRGQVRGVIPKSHLPNYREFYDKRHFAPARSTLQRSIHLQGVDVPFGPDLIFTVPRIGMTLHVEICEDLWVPIPPSTEAALAGANVLVNLSASNVTVGKPEYRRLLCAAQSAKCVAAYLYSGAGPASRPPTWRGTGILSSTRAPSRVMVNPSTTRTTLGTNAKIRALSHTANGGWHWWRSQRRPETAKSFDQHQGAVPIRREGMSG